MEDRVEFLDKLNALLEMAKSHEQKLTIAQVQEFFRQMSLTDEQMEMVYEYLLAQKVTVIGYKMPAGKTGRSEKTEPVRLSVEEQAYVEDYLAQLAQMPEGAEEAGMAYYLPKVVEEAVKLHHPDVFIGDMIQEGSVSLMLAIADGDKTEAHIMEAVRAGMQVLVESQTETKRQDERMAARVAELEETIKGMTEEFGRKVSVDEVAERLGITETEVNNILKLAGEEMKEEDG